MQISGRNVSDYRLLLAAIHTDVQPLSNVRGRCYVRHKDRIDDLLAWKKRPDHFYFIKYFDPYIKREFEVLRTVNATNSTCCKARSDSCADCSPARSAREAAGEVRIPHHGEGNGCGLDGRFQVLLRLREVGCIARVCPMRVSLLSRPHTGGMPLTGRACKNHYHMSCLNPPLVAKPAKGYSWVCLPCSLQRRKDIEEQKFHYGNGSAPKLKVQLKAKEKTAGDVKRPDVSYRGWPWRYFG